jgi:hypothetical protein
MTNKILLIPALALLLFVCDSHSQAPTPPFSMKIILSPSNAKVGSNVVVQVELTNTTSKRVGTDVCLGMTVECNFDIFVRDSHGNPASETRYLKAVRGENAGSPLIISAPSIAGMSVEPGQTVKFSSNLSDLFDISRPDSYEIQVQRWDSYTNKNIPSSSVHLTVSAQ